MNKREILTATLQGDRTVYTKGLPSWAVDVQPPPPPVVVDASEDEHGLFAGIRDWLSRLYS